MAHTHSHGPGDSHHHGDEDPYYLDQLCQVAVAAIFGGICLVLYFFRSGDDQMLDLMLSRRFYPYLLGGGATILIIALVRAACLWQQAREDRAHAGHDHGHIHDHDHPHDHAHDHHHNHDHGHSHDHEHHEHEHKPAAGPHPHAEAGHQDHEHGWAPWRYVVLMVPIILFLLGLPNKAPTAFVPNMAGLEEPLIEARLVNESKESEAIDHPYLPAIVAAGSLPSLVMDPFSPLTLTGSFAYEKKEKYEHPLSVEYRKLFDSAQDEKTRKHFNKRMVLVKGKFRPFVENQRIGIVARFLRQCCSADAVQITIPIVSRKNLTSISDDNWVHVRGRVNYMRQGDKYVLRILVQGPQDVTMEGQDESAYIDN